MLSPQERQIVVVLLLVLVLGTVVKACRPGGWVEQTSGERLPSLDDSSRVEARREGNEDL
jgi:hypothetical protein